MEKVAHLQVSVLVSTYRRPEGIRKCLISLLEQQTDIPYEIVVTENEAGYPSREVIEPLIQQAEAQGISVKYVCEPRKGYSFVRNRGVEEASGEYLAFIDDDETAAVDWLQQLMNACREWDADAVHGRVEYLFPDNFPQWMRRIDFYERHRGNPRQESFEAPWFGTNNLLLKRSTVHRTPIFDEAFSYTGMEDADLGVYLVTLHRKIIQAPQAIVREMQSLQRSRPSFFFRRSAKEGYALAKIGFKYFGRVHGLFFLGSKFLERIGMGMKYLPQLFRMPRVAVVNMILSQAPLLGFVVFLLREPWYKKDSSLLTGK